MKEAGCRNGSRASWKESQAMRQVSPRFALDHMAA
ncbi:MAG: xylose isomerase, partial [Mesorhizobium sp.]